MAMAGAAAARLRKEAAPYSCMEWRDCRTAGGDGAAGRVRLLAWRTRGRARMEQMAAYRRRDRGHRDGALLPVTRGQALAPAEGAAVAACERAGRARPPAGLV